MADLNFVGRLNRAINACKRLKSVADKKNNKMLRAYASNYYRQMESKDPHPLNMIDRAVSIWMPFLVSGEPKIIIDPIVDLSLKPFAYTFQLALNQWMKNMKFAARTFEPSIFNSLFGQGITKTGTHRSDIKRLAGYLTEIGKPYCEVVDFNNYLFDITAKDREQYEFEGDEYILPTERAKELFPKHADNIKPDFKLYGEEHPKTVTNPENISYNELHDYSAFVDLWLPREKVIVTILPHYKNYTKLLNTIHYEGPESGPYDTLGYKIYTGSTIPIPPIYSLMELDAAINVLFAKARNQAERIKRLGVYEAGNERDAQTAKEASDGDMIGLSNAQSVKELTLGGVVPEAWEFLGFSLSQFSEQGGITGLDYKSRAKTATQEQMLMTNAARTLDRMAQKVHEFASSIAEKLAFEMWQNPTLQIEAIKEIPGIAQIPVKFNQLQQEGDFLDYKFDIEMFSMQRLSPEARFNKMMQLLTAWILPTASMAAQQGKILNVPEITKTLSLYTNIDTESWFLSEMPQTSQLNPYQPMGGTGMRSSDQRFGAAEFDNANNRLAQQISNIGTTTKEI